MKTIEDLEKETGQELSENGKKWFNGLLKNSPFYTTMDDILIQASFLITGIEPFRTGRQMPNEWDELDATVRAVIEKTGYGKHLLEKMRSLHGHKPFIDEQEKKELEARLRYYPDLHRELARNYKIFTELAPLIHRTKDILKRHAGGDTAVRLCYIVGCIKEKQKASLKEAVSIAMRNQITTHRHELVNNER